LLSTESRSNRVAWATLGAVLVALCLPEVAFGDWLITVDGQRLETDGPWTVQGKRIVYTTPTGTLVSVTASNIDLAASQLFTEWAGTARGLPPGWIEISSGRVAQPPPELLETAMAGAGHGLQAEEMARVEARQRRLTELEDEEGPGQEITRRFLGRPLVLGGLYRASASFDGDLRPDNDRDDERSRQEHQLQLQLYYQASPNVALFFKPKVSYESDLDTRGEGSSDSEVEVKASEAWLNWGEIGGSGFGLQIGRQALRDRRRWWWSGNLDAVRVSYERGPVEAQVAVAGTFNPLSSEQPFVEHEDEDANRALGSVSWRYRRRHSLELFALSHLDRPTTPLLGAVLPEGEATEIDADLDWLGLRFTGERRWGRGGSLRYWADTGYVQGIETEIDFEDIEDDQVVVDEVTERQIEGWGVDLGLTWRAAGVGRPALTLRYAIGSGDRNPDDLRDQTFRQSGIHSNSGRFQGVNGFRYYGELLDPELSNLEILTAGVGFRFLDSSSIELVGHRYWQVEPTTTLRNARVRSRPDGVNADVGTGIDLVLGIQEWQRMRFRLFGSAFRPGAAFPKISEDVIYGGRAQVQFVF
jgi:alginate production protein